MAHLRLYLRYILPALLFLWPLFSLPSRAQIGESRREIAVGVSGGMTMNSIGFDPTVNQKQLLGPTFGAALRITSEKYFKTLCALQIELNYARLGWNEDIQTSTGQPLPDRYRHHISYLQLPLMARLGWGHEERGFMGYLLAGPQLGYALGDSEIYSEEWTVDGEGTPDRLGGMTEQYGKAIDHKFDYGITAGLGVEWRTRSGHFMLDARYYYGLSDIFANGKKDTFARSNHNTISVRFTYLIPIRK